MAHQYHQNGDGSGFFRDAVSGKRYEFSGGKDGPANKTAAKQSMLQDQAVIRRANEARPKVEKPWYGERVSAIVDRPRDARLGDVQHVANTATPESMAQRNVAFHQSAFNNAKTEADRGKAMRRLSAAQAALERAGTNQAKRDARAEHLADPRLNVAITRSEAVYQDLLARADVSSEFVELARQNMVQLKHSKDFDGYLAAERQLEQRFNLQRDAKLAQMQNTLEFTKKEIEGVAALPGVAAGTLLPEASSDD